MIASLGDASLPVDEKQAIAKAVESALTGQGDWLEDTTLSQDASSWVAQIVQLARNSKGGNQALQAPTADGVLWDEIQTENVLQLGPEWLRCKLGTRCR